MATLLGISSVILLLTCASFATYELVTYRRAAVRELSTLAGIVAAQSTAALAFDNQRDATEILSALRAEPHVVRACLYDNAGRLFARYPADASDADFPSSPGAPQYRFQEGQLVGSTPVVQASGSDPLGTLYLRTDMGAVYERVRLYGLTAVLVILFGGSVAFALSRLFERQLSQPIMDLAEAAMAVSRRTDYSVRVTKHGEDELGALTEAFNHMLARIQAQNAELENRVRERTAELEAANKELEAFCSSAAHDLRTPLRAITGFTDMLLDERAEPLPPQAQRYLGAIRTGSAQMEQLVQDLLAFSRVGRQDLKRRPVDLAALCRNAYDQLHGETHRRAVEFTLGQLPTVEGDPALLQIVFSNLFSNALKYSRDSNPIRIVVGRDDAEDPDQVVVFIRDNGVGFDMKDAGKLFGVFQRLHHTHEFEGTGVGLATVRRIVERHGGRTWAAARPGAGATFYVSLPRRVRATGHDADMNEADG